MTHFLAWMLCFGFAWAAHGAMPTGDLPPTGPALTDPLAGLHSLELPVLVRFQESLPLGQLMRYVSKLGPLEFGGAVAGVLFLGFRPRAGLRVGVFLLAALWFREVLALGLHSPRPYWIEPRLQSFGEISAKTATFGLPSGHVLAGTALWLYLAAEWHRAWGWVLAGAVSLAIAVSRVYLGVHFISDVTLGVLIGVPFAFAYRRFEPAVLEWLARSGTGSRAGVVGLVAVAAVGVPWVVREVFATGVAPEAWGNFGQTARRLEGYGRFAGAFLGIGLGLLMRRELPALGGVWWQRLARIVITGGVAYFVLRPAWRAALRELTEGAGEAQRVVATTLVYAAAAWSGISLLPGFFRRCGLAPTPPASPPRPAAPAQ